MGGPLEKRASWFRDVRLEFKAGLGFKCCGCKAWGFGVSDGVEACKSRYGCIYMNICIYVCIYRYVWTIIYRCI